MNVLKKLRQKIDEHAGKKAPDQLEIGKLYQVYKFDQRLSDYPKTRGGTDYPMTLIAYFKDNVNNYYLTLPTIYNDISKEDCDELNKQIQEMKPPSICYYGKDGNRNDVIIHDFEEGVDSDRLKAYKERASSNEPPLKKSRSGDL